MAPEGVPSALCVVHEPSRLNDSGRGTTRGHSNISAANELAGSHVGSQHLRAPADTRPRPATVIAGSRHTGRCLAMSGDGSALYGMQKVGGSNPLSSTRRAGRPVG